jgi:glycosyltransferase involved in cell wall biosynthesis
MKKKLLFIMNSLTCGGAEKALVSLLQAIDYSKYEVDLYLFKHEGLFMGNIPKEVTLLSEPIAYRFFDMPFKDAVLRALKMGRFDIMMSRIFMTYIYKTENDPSVKEQKAWRYIAKCIKPINKKYDFAAGYLQRSPDYFCAEKVNAGKKAGFIHTDYGNINIDVAIDRQYLSKLDKIFTVSETCKINFLKKLPELQNKVEVMYNILSPKTIEDLALELIPVKGFGHTIVSLGRLHPAKGYDLAIKACGILKNRGYKINWRIIGEGDERAKLEQLVKDENLENEFIINGVMSNPYPYVKDADVYVQTSRFEGKSIAIDEAKILGVPIVVTNFETAKDQISDGENGLITDMNPEAVAGAIEKLLTRSDLRNHFIQNLSQENLGNQDEMNKLYTFIEGKM